MLSVVSVVDTVVLTSDIYLINLMNKLHMNIRGNFLLLSLIFLPLFSFSQEVDGYWSVSDKAKLNLLKSGSVITTSLDHDVIDMFKHKKNFLYQSSSNKKLFLEVLSSDTIVIFNVDARKMNVLTRYNIVQEDFDNGSAISSDDAKKLYDFDKNRNKEISVYSSIPIDEQESPIRLGFFHGNPKSISFGASTIDHPNYISDVTMWVDDPITYKGGDCTKMIMETPSYSNVKLKTNICLLCRTGDTYISIEDGEYVFMKTIQNPMEFFGCAFSKLTDLQKPRGYFIGSDYTSFSHDEWADEPSSSSTINKSIGVGDKVYWTEKETYRTGSSGNVFGDMLFGDLYNSTYIIEYAGIVEALIGDKLKVIIQDVGMQDPKLASYNYIQAKSEVYNQASRNMGQTRIKERGEVELF